MNAIRIVRAVLEKQLARDGGEAGGSQGQRVRSSSDSHGLAWFTARSLKAARVAGLVAIAGAFLPACQAEPGDTSSGGVYQGICDASAMVMLGGEHFVVADDEDNVLRIYSRLKGGMPVHQVDLTSFLWADSRSPEADIEGAARVGDRIYWVTSHGRNKDGELRVSRRRFFATRVRGEGGEMRIEPLGVPYDRLLGDLLNDARLAGFGLAAAAMRAPKAGGALNIEGMCPTADGALLLGFRNPIPRGRALIVPLLNPGEVVGGGAARLGNPVLLDLGGLGVRSLTLARGRYWIVAGSHEGGGESVLYEWSGGEEPPRRLELPVLEGLNPEAMDLIEGAEGAGDRFLVLSDDGTREIEGNDCKKLDDPRKKIFRAVTIEL